MAFVDYHPNPALLDGGYARALEKLGERNPEARRSLERDGVRDHARIVLAVHACRSVTAECAGWPAWSVEDLDAALERCYDQRGADMALRFFERLYIHADTGVRAECSVCLQPLKASEAARRECGHAFHAACAARWTLVRSAQDARGEVPCPLCRRTWRAWGEVRGEAGAKPPRGAVGT